MKNDYANKVLIFHIQEHRWFYTSYILPSVLERIVLEEYTRG